MAGSYVLYEHKNKINGKRYIGGTNNTTKRWCGQGKHYEGCPAFWAALQKYGWDNFSHTVLVRNLSRDEASDLEVLYIAKYRTTDKRCGYNLASGGVSASTMTGKHHSEMTRQKIREGNLGKKHSEEQNRRHSEHMKGLMVGSRNHKSRAVRCINTGEEFESQAIAAKAKGVLQSKIWKCCNGQASHTHGLKWEYIK